MTKLLKAALLGSLLAVMPVAKVNAQTNTYRTNVLLNLTFTLTSYEQVVLFLSTNGLNGPHAPSAKMGKVVTSGVINAIANQANIPGNMANAKLYYRLSWTDPEDVSTDFILRVGNLDTNVNNYVLVAFPDSVTQERATLNGTTNAIDYANCNVSLGTRTGSFTLHGIATLKSASLTMNGHVIDRRPFPTSFSGTVAGSGSIGFHQAEWKGTVMGSGQKIEVEQISQ
jgi:hypothetical protein